MHSPPPVRRAPRLQPGQRALQALRLLLAGAVASLLTACAGAPTAESDNTNEVRVVTSGGFAAAFDMLAPQYPAATGVRIDTSYGSSSGGAVDSIPSRLARGEAFDIIILAAYSLDDLAARGHVAPGTRVDLVRSRIGMAVREGAPVPDISSPEAFVATLRAASSIGYSASASGTYLSTDLFPRIGLWDELAPKSTRILSKRVASVVATGEVEVGFQQISEILPIPGVTYVGPIPAAYQKTTTFSAAVTRTAPAPDAARALLAWLSSTAVAGQIAATGLSPVVLEDAPREMEGAGAR